MDNVSTSQDQQSVHDCCHGYRRHHWLAKIIIILLIFAAGYCFGVLKATLKYRFFEGYGRNRFFQMEMSPYDQSGQGWMMYRQ